MLKLQNKDGKKYKLKGGDIIILDHKSNLLSFSSAKVKGWSKKVKFNKLYFSQSEDNKYLCLIPFGKNSLLLAIFIAVMLGFKGVMLVRETDTRKYFSLY